MLFPSVDGQVPKVTAPEEVVQMVDETKDDIEKAVGGTIQKTFVVPEERVTDKPTKGKTLQFHVNDAEIDSSIYIVLIKFLIKIKLAVQLFSSFSILEL